MQAFLLILSAMLGTLTQANGNSININRCIEWSEVLSAFNQSALDEEEELRSEHLMEVSSWYCLGRDEWDFSERLDNLPQEIITFYNSKKELTQQEQWLLDQMIDHVKFLEFNTLCDSVQVYATTDEEFFAWQDAREQERLDAIMDQPTKEDAWGIPGFSYEEVFGPFNRTEEEVLQSEEDNLKDCLSDGEYYIYPELADDSEAFDKYMEAKVWEHHAWLSLEQEIFENLVTVSPYDHLIVEDCTTTEEDWLFFHPEGSDNSTLSDNPYGFDEDLDDYPGRTYLKDNWQEIQALNERSKSWTDEQWDKYFQGIEIEEDRTL